MEYQKPTTINVQTVNSAICGSGPCGRPCSYGASGSAS